MEQYRFLLWIFCIEYFAVQKIGIQLKKGNLLLTHFWKHV